MAGTDTRQESAFVCPRVRLNEARHTNRREILYKRLRNEGKLVGEGISSQEERTKQLKRPLSIDTLPRTEFLIEYLAENGYESRVGVINACENVLADMLISTDLLKKKLKS